MEYGFKLWFMRKITGARVWDQAHKRTVVEKKYVKAAGKKGKKGGGVFIRLRQTTLREREETSPLVD